MFASISSSKSNLLALNISDLQKVHFKTHLKNSFPYSRSEVNEYLTFCFGGFELDNFESKFLEISIGLEDGRFPILVELYRQQVRAGNSYYFLPLARQWLAVLNPKKRQFHGVEIAWLLERPLIRAHWHQLYEYFPLSRDPGLSWKISLLMSAYDIPSNQFRLDSGALLGSFQLRPISSLEVEYLKWAHRHFLPQIFYYYVTEIEAGRMLKPGNQLFDRIKQLGQGFDYPLVNYDIQGLHIYDLDVNGNCQEVFLSRQDLDVRHLMKFLLDRIGSDSFDLTEIELFMEHFKITGQDIRANENQLLLTAVYWGHHDLVEYLIIEFDLDLKDLLCQDMALFKIAALKGRQSILRLICDHFSIDRTFILKAELLTLAAQNNHLEVIQYLLEKYGFLFEYGNDELSVELTPDIKVEKPVVSPLPQPDLTFRPLDLPVKSTSLASRRGRNDLPLRSAKLEASGPKDLGERNSSEDPRDHRSSDPPTRQTRPRSSDPPIRTIRSTKTIQPRSSNPPVRLTRSIRAGSSGSKRPSYFSNRPRKSINGSLRARSPRPRRPSDLPTRPRSPAITNDYNDYNRDYRMIID